jgi:hypothetical protein
VAFQLVNDKVGLYNHVADCIQHDRLIKKFTACMPRISPWKDAKRFFPFRPSTKNIGQVIETIEMYWKEYGQPDCEETLSSIVKRVQRSQSGDRNGARFKESKMRLCNVRNFDAYNVGTL